jgi:hypothetical protein
MAKKKSKLLSPQEKLDNIRTYLQEFIGMSDSDVAGQCWIDYYRLIYERGKHFLTCKPPADYPEIKRWCICRRPKMKECYWNAQLLVLDFDGKGPRYFEGFAFYQMMPTPHAWVVMPDGNVCDVTLDAKDAKLGTDSQETVYLGVPLPFKTICRYIVKFKVSGPFANLHYLKAKDRLIL